MMDLYELQIFLLAVTGIICLFMALFSRLIDYQSEQRKKAINRIESTTAILLLSNMLSNIFRGVNTSGAFLIVRVCAFLSFFLLYIELLWLYYYICSYIPPTKRSITTIDKISRVIYALGIILIIVSQFTGIYYSFDSNNTYTRGPLFIVSFILPTILLFLAFIKVISLRAFFPKLIGASAVIFTLGPIVCGLIQLFVSWLPALNLSIGLAAILVFSFSLLELNMYLTEISSKEKMTGLLNSHGFIVETNKHISKGDITQYAAMYLDIMRMSMVNRKYGSHAGDEAIIAYAKAFQNAMEDGELISRLGGNYFVALVKKDNLQKFIDMLNGIDVVLHMPAGNETITLSTISGIYQIDTDEIEPENIMTNISMAVNIAKNIEKKQYVILTPEHINEMNNQRQLQAMIPTYMELGEFVAYYQPKVDLSTNTLCGAEALARWEHNGELIPPFKFIPLMERNESICKFDFYMLEKICSDISEWMKAGITNIPIVSINFSRKNLGNLNFVEDIYNVIKKYNVDPHLIQIEITETIDEYPLEALQVVVEALQKYGFTAAIDDFGTGSSSIKLLKEIPFDVLKVDKSFIDSISEQDKNVLGHIIGMADTMGASVITEGVERDDQIKVLKDLGCKEVQGYYFDKPLPKTEFESRMRNPVY